MKTVIEYKTEEPTEFQTVLLASILAKIQQLKREGTAGISVDCLIQNVNAPSWLLDGAPLGTNAVFFYRRLFRQICKDTPEIAQFVLT